VGQHARSSVTLGQTPPTQWHVPSPTNDFIRERGDLLLMLEQLAGGRQCKRGSLTVSWGVPIASLAGHIVARAWLAKVILVAKNAHCAGTARQKRTITCRGLI